MMVHLKISLFSQVYNKHYCFDPNSSSMDYKKKVRYTIESTDIAGCLIKKGVCKKIVFLGQFKWHFFFYF